MPRKYELPSFLVGSTSQALYEKWLRRKAASLQRRDKRHNCGVAQKSGYLNSIHQAVVCSEGMDFYTGEELDWTLICTYDNELSRTGRLAYKAKFALLPTVDHVTASNTNLEFAICSWRVNDAKNDLSTEEFVALCRKVTLHHDRRITG